MEKRFVAKNSEWSSRSGVLLDMVNNGQFQNNASQGEENQYHSPKGVHPNVPPGNLNHHANFEAGENSPNINMNGNPLIAANLPTHMFMQAVNFDTLQTIPDSAEDRTSERQPEDGVINGSLNMSDAQADLLEQQQAMEQAKLLKRFKELRQWQLQQQQLLMFQQQSQLMALKSEQNRVQEMITKQRQNQWGGKVTVTSESSPFRSPRKRTVKPAGIAEALAGAVVNRYQQVHGVSERGDSQTESSNLQSRKGLPRPELPDTDSEGGCHTNPELYSNPGSIDSHDSADLRPLTAQPVDDESDSDYHLDEPAELYNYAAGLQNGKPDQMFSDTDSLQNRAAHQHQNRVAHQQHGTVVQLRNPNHASHLQTAPIPWSQKSPREITQNRLAKSEGYELDTDEGIGTQSFHSSPLAAQPDTVIEEDGEGLTVSGQGQNDRRQGGYHPREDKICEEISAANDDLDERPVSSAVGGRKTFEDLLEEQLRAEEEQQSPRSPEKPVKRPFLRRGQGLERFKGPPKRKAASVASKPSTVNKKQDVPKRTISSTKASSTAKVSKTNNKTTGAKSETGKTDPAEAKLQKKSVLAPKAGQGLPGIAQKSLKLHPLAQNSSVAGNKKVNGSEQAVVSAERTDPNPKEAKPASSNNERKPAEPQQGLKGVDASFLSHLEKLQENEVVEEEDLEEFEMLEHFADNASFSSNSSLVVKVLQKDRWKAANLQGNTAPMHQPPMYYLEDHKRFFVPPVVSVGNCEPENKTAVTEDSPATPDVIEYISSDSDSSSSDSSDTETEDNDLLSTIKHGSLLSQGVDLTRKSSQTSGKFDGKLQMDACQEDNQRSSASDYFWNSRKRSDSESSDNEKTSAKSDLTKSPLRRKIAGRNSNSSASSSNPGMKNSASTTEEISGGQFLLRISQNNSDSEALSPSSDEEVEKSHPSNSQSANRNTNHPEDHDKKDKYKHRSEGNSGKSDGNSGKDLCEDEFDDEEEWGDRSVKQSKQDSDMSDDSEGNDTLIEEHGTGNHDKSDSGLSPRSGTAKSSSPVKPSPPPTSKLITKLFPKLRPHKPSPKEQEQEDKLKAAKEVPVNDGVQSKLLRDKLAELETEINKFRAENANLERLRKEREEGLTKLKKEIQDFEKEKNEELQRLNEFKAQELKKLKHEKKVFEKYQKAARAMPDKKEREEIETLRSQLSDLQEELKRKESRWSSNTTCLKNRMEEIEQENTELKEEIKLLEKKRLEWLQKEKASKTSAGQNRNHAPLSSSMNSVSNGFGFINTDSEEEVDPVRDDKKKQGRSHALHVALTKPDSKKLEKPIQNISHKPARPKSGKLASSNRKPDKPNSPSKSSNQKKGHLIKSPNKMRTSLTEDLPRGHITAEAPPQLLTEISSVANSDLQIPQQSRKLAARFDVDKSTIDKGGDYEEIQHADGKIERIFNTGAREILFSNGTRKEISSDGQAIIVSFFNGDVKQIMSDQRVVYYYSEAQTTHSTYPDGLEILQFPNNQVEKHYPDGTKEITFPDQTVKYLFPSGVEESVFPDGTVIRVEKTGEKTIEFPNGQREIHTQQFKKREYPDGTVKTVFPDGRQETRYSNGRIRVKDKEGNVIMDKRS